MAVLLTLERHTQSSNPLTITLGGWNATVCG